MSDTFARYVHAPCFVVWITSLLKEGLGSITSTWQSSERTCQSVGIGNPFKQSHDFGEFAPDSGA